MKIYEYKTTVQFSDIDEENRLSAKGLIRILQEAAGLHSESVGYGLNSLRPSHIGWMILDWKIKFYSRPCWNTNIIVKTWPHNFTRIASPRDFEVYDKNNSLIAIASSKWILVNYEKLTISKMIPEIIEAFGENDKSVFDTPVNDKEQEPKNSQFVYEYTVTKRDIDTNHHVNNLYYLDYAYEALPKEFWNKNFDNVEIIYKKQIKLGDTIKCFYAYDENTNQHIVTIKNNDLSVVHSIIKLY